MYFENFASRCRMQIIEIHFIIIVLRMQKFHITHFHPKWNSYMQKRFVFETLYFLRCGPLTGEVIRDTMKIFRKGQGSFGHIRVRDEDNINLNSSPHSSGGDGGFCADHLPLRTTVRGGNLISCPDGYPTSPSLATRTWPPSLHRREPTSAFRRIFYLFI